MGRRVPNYWESIAFFVNDPIKKEFPAQGFYMLISFAAHLQWSAKSTAHILGFPHTPLTHVILYILYIQCSESNKRQPFPFQSK